MIINLIWNQGTVEVIREAGDPAYYGVKNAGGESRLLYAIKAQLKLQGHDMVKKRMSKDGHLVDEMQQYLRTRQGVTPAFSIWNDRWAIEGAEVDYNAGKATLALTVEDHTPDPRDEPIGHEYYRELHEYRVQKGEIEAQA